MAPLVCLSLLLAPGVTQGDAADVPPKDPFAEAKRANGVQHAVSLRTLRLHHSQYAGKTVEVVGTVVGRISAGRRTTYLVKDAHLTDYVESAQSVPGMTNGQRVRILVKVPKVRMASNRLQLVAAASAPITREPVRAVAKSEAPADPPAPATPPEDEGTAVPAPIEPDPEPAEEDQAASVTLTPATSLEQRLAELRPKYAKSIRGFNSRLSQAHADWIADLILRFSIQNQIDPRLVIAIVAAESNFKLTATSPKGAMGLGQLMPGTAAGMGVTNAYDPAQNLAAAVRIIRGNMDKYRQYGDRQFAMALAAYNAGSGAIKKYGGVPPYRETVNYIWKVYRLYKELAPDMFR